MYIIHSVAADRQEMFEFHRGPGFADLNPSRPSNNVFETFTDVSVSFLISALQIRDSRAVVVHAHQALMCSFVHCL